MGFASKQNEVVLFDKATPRVPDADLPMHSILKNLETGMVDSLKRSTFRSLVSLYTKPSSKQIPPPPTETLLKIIEQEPVQCIVLALQIIWTQNM